jgi:antitoxin HicB
MAADALNLMIAEQIRNGEPLPQPRVRRGSKYRPVHLPATQAAKAELYRQFMAAGIRKSELARRMGISNGNIERLFDLNHNSRLDQIEAAFRALGKTLAIEVRDAA